MSVHFTFRPLSAWPRRRTLPGARGSGRFRAPYDGTVAILTQELAALHTGRAARNLTDRRGR